MQRRWTSIAIHGWILTQSAIVRRGIIISNKCNFCDHEDTKFHFLCCKKTSLQKLWSEFGSMIKLWMVKNLFSNHITSLVSASIKSFYYATVPRIEPGRISGFHLGCGLIQIEWIISMKQHLENIGSRKSTTKLWSSLIIKLWDHLGELWGLTNSIKDSIHETPD